MMGTCIGVLPGDTRTALLAIALLAVGVAGSRFVFPLRRTVTAMLLVTLLHEQPPAAATSSAGAGGVAFVDEAIEAGVVAVNVSGSAEKRYILETTGSGACFLDYDGDGDVDLYLVNGATLDIVPGVGPVRDTLYRNDGDGRFTDATGKAGLAGEGWGGGCAVGDYDNDGDPDLYLTHYGPNVLYRNQGDGTFRDVTAAAGVGDARWSVGAAFLDYDRDGDLDIYVANYLRFDLAVARASACLWKGIAVMCGPRGFEGEADALYRNDGNGSFTDVSAEAGIAVRALYGMGVVAGDLDADGDVDLFVADDSQDNHFFVNDGRGRFQDGGLSAGLALSGDGRQQAGMGTDLGDYDNDGDEDVVLTTFSDDYHTLFRNEGNGLFSDVTAAAGLDPATRSSLGWGVGFFDHDNDGYLDLFVASGHVYPQVDGRDSATTYRQRNLLFRNDGRGRFTDVSLRSGPGLQQLHSSRGVAFGDYDDDGDMDLVVINENDAPSLLRNDGGSSRRWLKVRLIGSRSNRDGIGARLQIWAGARRQFREARVNAGYCSSHDPRIHFGLDREVRVQRLEVTWPSGIKQAFEGLPANRLVTIHEERGLLDVSALKAARRAAPSALMPRTAASPLPAAEGGFPPLGGGRLSPSALREVDGLVQAGTRRLMAGQYTEGIEAYAQALKRLPPWEEASRSADALGFGDPQRYRSFLASLYDNVGVGLMRAERLDECAPAIERGLALDPGRAKFHHNLGLCHFHGRRYHEAVEALEAARAAGDAGALLDYNLGRALALGGRCPEAPAELTRSLERMPRPDRQGRDAEAWYHLGTCAAEQGRHGEAAFAFREALALAPGHQKALYRLGLSLRRLGRTGPAERVEGLFKARQPADETLRGFKISGLRATDERLHSARLHVQAGLPGQALVELEIVRAARPAGGMARLVLGQALVALRPPLVDEAEQAFREVLAEDPRQADALAGLGEVLRSKGRASEAEARFRGALALQPDHDAAHFGLARVLVASGRVQEAWRLLERTRSLYGEDVEARVQGHLRLGEKEAATKLIEESPFLGRTQREALLQQLTGR